MPSGVSYVISNRRVMAQTLPELFTSMRVRPVGDYPNRLLQALRASAPEGVEDPTVVVLTPGVYNSAYYEHTLLARLMGVELVEGRDLFCSGGRVWMRTTAGPTRVDVIYRRVDDEFLDPQQFRPDSVLGAPGLMLAARLGHVTIANAVGNGVADDKLVYTYVPELIRYFLGEEPILPNVDTWRLEEPDALAEVLDRLDELVVKPVDGSGGKGLVVGPDASRSELAELRVRLLADPRGWIAQPVVQLSTIPTLVEDGMRPRHADLRPFAVNDGNDVWVLPGGLTRVALPEGQLVVNSSQGGGSKDTWVLDGDPPTGPLGAQRFASAARGRRRRSSPTRPRSGDGVARRSSRPTQRRRACAASARGLAAGRGRADPPAAAATAAAADAAASARRGEVPDAEPHRRVAVLDRPLHRAQRRHRPHPRRAPAAAARGPVDRRGHRLPVAALGHGQRGERRRRARPRRRHRAARRRPHAARVDRALDRRPPARTPAAPARSSRPSCGRPSTRRTHGCRGASPPTRRTSSSAGCATAPRSPIGVVDSATSRDEAWHFFSLGRAIERADMTARLLATRSLTEASGPSWTTILRSCGGYEAYLRSYRGVPSTPVGGRVPAARPAVPAVDHLERHPRRGVAARDRPPRRAASA